MLAAMLAIGVAWAPATRAQASQGGAPTREEVERAPVRSAPPPGARLAIDSGPAQPPCALDDTRYDALQVRLTEVSFTGLGPVSPELLRPAYAGELGADRKLGVLCAIRDRAAAILNDAGYLAVVEIPEQQLSDGQATFRVVLGRLTAVRVRGEVGRSQAVIARTLEPLTRQPVFNRADAERVLLLAGDLPGHEVRLSLRAAGTGPGELVGEVAVVRTTALVTANIQNYGSDALGPFGGLVTAELFGLTGLGDRTTLSAFTTLDFAEQATLRLGHDFRVGGGGLVLSGQITGSWGHPTVDLDDIDIDTSTLFATLQASYPLARTRAFTSRGAIGLDLVDQDVDLNELALTRDRLRVLFARLDFDTIDQASLAFQNGYSSFAPRWRAAGALDVRQGLDIIDASSDCRRSIAACFGPGRVPTSRVGADPTGLLARFAGTAEYRPVPEVAIVVGVRGQVSGDPLLAFEEFSAGNYTIGRGYDPGTILGDSGLGASLEARYGLLLPKSRDAVAFQPYAFVDLSKVWNEDAAGFGGASARLSSIGAGLRAVWGDRAQADAALAVPLERAGAQDRRGDVRFLLSITTKLLPWSVP